MIFNHFYARFFMAISELSHSLRRSSARRVRKVAIASCAWSVMLAPAAVNAQMSPFGTMSMGGGTASSMSSPMGSPLDPSMSGAGQQQQSPYLGGSVASNPIEPVQVGGLGSGGVGGITSLNSRTQLEMLNALNGVEPTLKRAADPNEFERFVERMTGKALPRFGADLIIPATRDFSTPAVTTIPSSYVMSPGDTLLIGLSGSIDGSIDAQINTDGEVFLPKVGPVKLAGVTYGELKNVLTRALGKQFRDFRISVTIGQLRGIRVYVTGYANAPGGYTVNGLSTIINAVLAAGGPSGGGSFRAVRLYRNGELVSTFDLYDFILRGDKSKDIILQSQDVLYIPPVGAQAAITGSVNQEAIYETKPGETLGNLLRYSGGTSVLADSSRVILYRIADRERLSGAEVSQSALGSTPVSAGDIVQVMASGSLIQPLERQSVMVRIEGEVQRPGNYFVAPNTNLDQVMGMAGGFTTKAFVYGTNLQRVSVRLQQRESFNEAIKQLEVSLAAAPLTKDSSIDNTSAEAQAASAKSVLDRLREAEPDGRVVLDIAANSTTLPSQLQLENNDRLYIPARPTTVGVFGAVYRPASFLIDANGPKKVGDYLEMAGGPLRAGDKAQIFVVRANGAVISKRKGALSAPVIPGDVIFVPVKTQTNTVWAKIQQISTVLFQLGITAAAFVAISK